jgi:hypothetical protein
MDLAKESPVFDDMCDFVICPITFQKLVCLRVVKSSSNHLGASSPPAQRQREREEAFHGNGRNAPISVRAVVEARVRTLLCSK